MTAGEPSRLHEIIALQAARVPDQAALWWQGEATSYAGLRRRIAQLAGRLAACGSPGDRVAVLAWNCPEFLEFIYGAPEAGRILVPLNARLAPAELAWQLRSAGVTRLFGEPALLAPLTAHGDFPSGIETTGLGSDYRQWLEQDGVSTLPPTEPEDPAWILYTSGTTGRPKGAVLTHQSFLAGLRSAELGRPVKASDRYLYPFPLFHVAAHNVLLQHKHGAAVVLQPAFEAAETLRLCRELEVTSLSLAPTMIAMLLDHPDFTPRDLATVRSIGYGASAMPLTLLRRLQAETGIGLCQSYGMTELSGSVAFLTPEDHRLAASERPDLLASVGRPLPTAELRLVDQRGLECPQGERGEILVRAQQVMAGYWEQPGATAETLADGWLHTGDIGRLDREGYLYIVDRKKDMIISGGENIASREVEEVLRQHRAIRECAVIGLPDSRWGESLCAVLELREPTSADDLERFCRSQLAGYKTPRTWIASERLPVNAGGKIDKAKLRREIDPGGPGLIP